MVQNVPSSLFTSFSTQDAAPRLMRNQTLQEHIAAKFSPLYNPKQVDFPLEALLRHGHGLLSLTPQYWGGCSKSSSSSPFSAPWSTKWIPLYGTCPWRFDTVLTHQPPALCRKCHFSDTHPCRSVSPQGNKSSKQRNARPLGSQAQSCSSLSHSQAAAIPDILRLPASMQRRFAIKSLWDHC